MAIQKLQLSKYNGSSWVSNVAEVADATHDIGFAEIASTLGLNYDSTNHIMYKGSDTTHGIEISLSSSNLYFKLYYDGVVLTGSGYYLSVNTTRASSYLFYAKGTNGVAYGCDSSSSGATPSLLGQIVGTGTRTDGTMCNYYLHYGSSISSNNANFLITEDTASTDNINLFPGSIPNKISNLSTSIISMAALIKDTQDFICNNIYIAPFFPASLPQFGSVYKINNKEFVVLNRYNSDYMPILFDTGNSLS